MKSFLIILLIACYCCTPARAQEPTGSDPASAVIGIAAHAVEWMGPDFDSTYINDRSKDFMVRVYTSSSFNQFKIGSKSLATDAVYKTNDNLDLGLGFNYKFLGISVSFKMPFTNNGEDKYGKTKGFDLSTTVYSRRLTVDISALFAHGLYLDNNGAVNYQNNDGYLVRPDLRTQHIGVNGQYIFNYKKFSYRGAFVGTEVQKKSAGSIIIGGMAYYNHAKADSALLPSILTDAEFAKEHDFTRLGTVCLAINAGYGYTFVYQHHLFATAALTVGGGVQTTTAGDGTTHSGVGFQSNGMLRAGLGYNSVKYYAVVNYFRYFTRSSIPDYNSWQAFQSGSFTLTVGERFHVKRKYARKFDHVVDQVIPGASDEKKDDKKKEKADKKKDKNDKEDNKQ